MLTGERTHYEIAAGRTKNAQVLLYALENFANEGGLIPEQIWDAADIPGKELFLGRPSGSAMPLVWAHAEYVKLLRSIKDGKVFDTPPQTSERYIKSETASDYVLWRYNQKCKSLPSGKILRIELLASAVIYWSVDDWKNTQDISNRDTSLSVYIADIPSIKLSAPVYISLDGFGPLGRAKLRSGSRLTTSVGGQIAVDV